MFIPVYTFEKTQCVRGGEKGLESVIIVLFLISSLVILEKALFAILL